MDIEWHTVSLSGARRQLLPRLRGKVFHVTTPANALSIIQSGRIGSNQSNCYPLRWQGTSYFRKRGFVSVCDLHHNTSVRLTNEAALSKYHIFNQGTMGASAFFFLAESHYDRLVKWRACKKETGLSELVVPHLESGFPNEILLRDICAIWWVKVTTFSHVPGGFMTRFSPRSPR